MNDMTDLERRRGVINLNVTDMTREAGYGRSHWYDLIGGRYPATDAVYKKYEKIISREEAAMRRKLNIKKEKKDV